MTTTLEVNNIVAGPQRVHGWRSGRAPFQPGVHVDLNVGDTFDFTVEFLPGQQLTIVNPLSLWAFSYAATISTQVDGAGTLSLLDAGGAPLHTSSSKTDTEGDTHFTQQFFSTDFPGLPSSVTFSGLRYVGKVDGYAVPGVNVRTHNSRRSTLRPIALAFLNPPRCFCLALSCLPWGPGLRVAVFGTRLKL